jgi:hypothetical protein
MTETRDARSEEQARAQLASIREMVAALECDYDRLAELRGEREDWEVDHGDARDWSDAEELAELEDAAGDCADVDQARERIEEDPLSVQVRSDWHNPGEDPTDAGGEFEILLCTGGPACRIIGELDESCEPSKARIEHQDWFTPWTDYPLTSDDEEAVLAYCRCFYFGS